MSAFHVLDSSRSMGTKPNVAERAWLLYNDTHLELKVLKKLNSTGIEQPAIIEVLNKT